MTSGIYQIRNLVTGRVYVGSAVDLTRREVRHRSDLARGVHPNAKLQNSFNKHGSTSLFFEVLEIVDDKEKLVEREQFWIDKLDSVRLGYNLAPIAGSQLGLRHSEVSRAKMSAARSGEKHPNFGKQLSAETRANISKANSGKTRSLEARANIAKGHMGLVQSAESRAKKSKALSGANNPMFGVVGADHPSYGKTFSAESRAKMSASQPSLSFTVVSPTGEVVSGKNASKFAREQGLNKGNFCKLLQGKAKTCKGWTLPT